MQSKDIIQPNGWELRLTDELNNEEGFRNEPLYIQKWIRWQRINTVLKHYC